MHSTTNKPDFINMCWSEWNDLKHSACKLNLKGSKCRQNLPIIERVLVKIEISAYPTSSLPFQYQTFPIHYIFKVSRRRPLINYFGTFTTKGNKLTRHGKQASSHTIKHETAYFDKHHLSSAKCQEQNHISPKT